jgi:hypothetical protein
MKRRPCFQLLSAVSWCALAAVLAVPSLCAAGRQPSEEEIRRRLSEVLARPDFSPEKKSLGAWLLELLLAFLAWLGGLRAASPVLFWLLLTTCVLLLLLLGGHIAWTVRRVFVLSSESRRGVTPEEKRRLLSLAYWEEATRRAALRDFTEAVRFLFLSLVYRFDETGRVLFHQAYTNREYLAFFADRPQVQSDLAVFVDTLDEHWYGQHPTDHQHYENCRALYESLK